MLLMLCVLSSAAIAQEPAGRQGVQAANGAGNKGSADPDELFVAKPDGKGSYTVLYTGRLFGYYRYPEVQTVDNQTACRQPKPAETPEEMQKFEEALANAPAAYGTTLRVAVGDNFAPFLLSRQMWDGSKKQLIEKESYSAYQDKWKLITDIKNGGDRPDRYREILEGTPQSIPIDNVGCFLRLEKFDAIVPGEFDFYFGVTRLQELAKYLELKIDDLHRTKMLGSNLYLQPREVVSALSQSAASTMAVTAGPSVSKAHGTVEVGLPKTVFPWMRTVQIRPSRGYMPKDSAACIVKAPKDSKPLLQSEQNICKEPAFKLTQLGKSPRWEIEGTGVLDQSADYAVAVVSESQLVAWQPFTVARPFFPFDITKRESRPWVIKEEGGKRVAVFGIVDPNLIQFIGRYNAVWLEEKENDGEPAVDDHFETDLQISDPGEALDQAVEYCRSVKDCDEKTRIVLLAQMPEQTAYDMIESFRSDRLAGIIDLVVTEADPARGTGNRITVRQPANDREEFQDPVVVVPNPGALVGPQPDKIDQMHVRLQQAVVTPGDYDQGVRMVVRNRPFRPKDDQAVTNNWFSGPVAQLTAGPNARTLLAHLDANLTKDTELAGSSADIDSWKLGLQQVALKTMEHYCHSDAAMLQLRDVFWVPKFGSVVLTDKGFEAVMDAIFWKGDYISCMNVSGGTVTSVLQRSQDLKEHQYYGSVSDQSLSNDWSLITLGANEEQKDPAFRLMSGKLLDSKKLYSVATSDFLANGDTGYPALQGAEPLPQTPWSKTKLIQLSQAIAHPDHFKEVTAFDVLDTLPYADLPDSVKPKPNLTSWNWFKGIFHGPSVQWDTKTDCDPKAKGSHNCIDPLQFGVQERSAWSFELYKSDFSYSTSWHSGLERTVPLNFPGVSAVDLTAADSSSISYDGLFRVQYDVGRNEVYLQGEANYGYSKRRQASSSAMFMAPLGCSFYPTATMNPAAVADCGDPYSRNQPADFAYGEFGYAFHVRKYKPYGMKLQAPAAVQTQLTPSVALPEGVSGAQSTPSLTFPAPRSFYLSGRPGIRWEYSYPKPNNWSLSPGGGGAQPAGGQQASSGGGKGKGGSSATSSQTGQNGQNGQNGQGGQGGQNGGGQTQTFDSFVETGFEGGYSVYGPSAFLLSSSTYSFSAAPCSATAAGTIYTVPVSNIASCLGGFDQAVNNAIQTGGKPPTVALTQILGGRMHFQDGLYLNYHFDTPLPVGTRFRVFSNIDIVSDLRSDFFLKNGGDAPIDTRFLVDAKESLNVPLFYLFGGKLSLAPTAEWIWYSNKISNNLYQSFSTSVSLSYTIERRSGLHWLKAFGYQNPVPAQPALPSR